MNEVTMLLQQMPLPVKEEKTGKFPKETDKDTLFYSLLSDSLTADILNNDQLLDMENEGASLFSLLHPFKIMADGEMNKEIMQQENRVVKEQVSGKVLEAELPEIPQMFVHIYQQAHSILSKLDREPSYVEKAAPKILQLLELWSAESKSVDQKELERTLTLLKQGETKGHTVWKDVLQTYEKRQQLASRQQYSINAQVTSEDIAKWLNRALENLPFADRLTLHQTEPPASMPMSRMEQVIVYLHQGQHMQAQGQQLVNEIKTMMSSGNLLAAPLKGSQITLSLRPENLGEMIIRFTQVNGEMTVKILVTTQAAKEMLETNMHQLRNMFSPQQVIVEKQEGLLQQNQEPEKSMKDHGQDSEQHQSNSGSSDGESGQSEDEDDFDSRLQTLLMNNEEAQVK
jgi:flagellar hook-length control protein FliK